MIFIRASPVFVDLRVPKVGVSARVLYTMTTTITIIWRSVCMARGPYAIRIVIDEITRADPIECTIVANFLTSCNNVKSVRT